MPVRRPDRSFFGIAVALLLTGSIACDQQSASQAPGATQTAANPTSQPQPARSVSPAATKLRRPYNLLLIMIDSLRADMPWTGYPRDIAPRLSEFAKKWVLYPRTYSLSSYTAKSVAPALCGQYPSEMPRDGRFFTRWLPANQFISERAQERGFATLAGHGHGYFLPGIGMDQGFSDYRLLKGTFLDLTGVHDVNSDRLYELAKEMLSKPENVEQTRGKRFFAYFHFLDPHYTYQKHETAPDFGEGRRDLYDNEVYFTDHWVGKLLDFSLNQPWADDTVIIVTADHGEGFGERGKYRHAYEVWESLVRVPMLIRVPGVAPRHIELSRSQIDLAPTMADLMDLGQSGRYRGESLVPEILGAKPEPRPVLVDLPRCDLMDSRRGFIVGDYKLISFGDDERFELFDVQHDRREEHELSRQKPELLKAMKAKYERFVKQIPVTPVTDSVALKGAPPGRRW